MPGANDTDDGRDDVPERFPKLKGAEYERVNEFVREYSYFTAREWAVLRTAQELRTATGVPYKRIGEELPTVAPFVDEAFSRQNVANCRSRAYDKAQQAGVTFAYATMSDAFDEDEVDELMHGVVDGARLLLEAEGASLDVADEQEAEDRIKETLEEVRAAARDLREQD